MNRWRMIPTNHDYFNARPRRSAGIGLLAALALAAMVNPACAQTNGEPGPQDYSRFGHFITDRNIFDPARQPHDYNRSRTFVRHTQRPKAAPGVQFVGTMSYEKGLFAFFSGNSDDLSRIVRVGDKFQDYTVTGIESKSVVLESADKKSRFLNLGDGLRQENGKWVISQAGELPPAPAAETAGAAGGDSGSSAEAPAAEPPSASAPNDVLKRLMQLREKENQ